MLCVSNLNKYWCEIKEKKKKQKHQQKVRYDLTFTYQVFLYGSYFFHLKIKMYE